MAPSGGNEVGLALVPAGRALDVVLGLLGREVGPDLGLGNGDLGVRGDEHGGVQHAVLRGAGERLAVEDQHGA